MKQLFLFARLTLDRIFASLFGMLAIDQCKGNKMFARFTVLA